MKRLIILLVSFMMITTTVNAEIIHEKDEFTGIESLTSEIDNVSEFRKVCLFTNPKKDNTVLAFFRADKEWYFFEGMSIKIDGKIYDIPLIDTSSDVKYSFTITSGMYSVNKVVNKIKNANEIEMRIRYSNHPSTTFKVSNDILKEWKEVLGENNYEKFRKR